MTNEIRIGDLGLATSLGKSHTSSVIGTPEFMAPEIYEERYGTKVDIYAFGMCLLEIVTMQIPYRECQSPAQIFKKVISGALPQAIDLVLNEQLKNFILKCLAPEAERPTATQLLQDPFLDPEKETEEDSQPVQLKETQLSRIPEESFGSAIKDNSRISSRKLSKKKSRKSVITQEEQTNFEDSRSTKQKIQDERKDSKKKRKESTKDEKQQSQTMNNYQQSATNLQQKIQVSSSQKQFQSDNNLHDSHSESQDDYEIKKVITIHPVPCQDSV